jgi:hypothetical protein
VARRKVFPKVFIGGGLGKEKDLHVPFSDRKSRKMGHVETWVMVRTNLGREMMRFGARAEEECMIMGSGRAYHYFSCAADTPFFVWTSC